MKSDSSIMSVTETKMKNVPAAGRSSLVPALNVDFRVRLVSVAALIAALLVVFGVNIGSIGQGLGLAMVGVGVFITFRVLNLPDLSVEGSFPMGGAVAAAMIVNYGITAEWTLLVSFLAGAVTGLVTALMYVLFVYKIENLLAAIIASIITLTGAYTFVLRIMGTSNIPLLNERTILTPYTIPLREYLIVNFGNDARRYAGNLVEIAVFLVVVLLVLAVVNWFLHTEIGLTMRAAGKNTQMVRAVGVDDKRMALIGLVLANGLSGLAGALFVQQVGFADVQMGLGMIVRGLAAVMIGEVLLRPRTVGQGLLAAVIGMVMFEVLRAWVFAAFNLDAPDIRLVSALVVFVALAAPIVHERWQNWRRKQRA